MGKIVYTVEDRIQKTILTAIDSNITPKIELAIRSINASSGRDATSVMANSERGEHIGISAPLENVSEENNALHVFNTNDETRNNNPDEVSDLSVPGTHFDGQPHTHNNYWQILLVYVWSIVCSFSSDLFFLFRLFLESAQTASNALRSWASV